MRLMPPPGLATPFPDATAGIALLTGCIAVSVAAGGFLAYAAHRSARDAGDQVMAFAFGVLFVPISLAILAPGIFWVASHFS